MKKKMIAVSSANNRSKPHVGSSFFCVRKKANAKGRPCKKQCTDCNFIQNDKTEFL